MTQRRNTYFVLVIGILMMFFHDSKAQFASKLIEYLPAPGQYTNAEFIGTPNAANSIVGINKGLVSLGAFGGSATYYFDQGIKNDPLNPYGVDFTVYGNATPTWSEPGIIQVMKDENKNGIPDETWFEIAGSDHFWNSTSLAYEVTFKNSGSTKASNIPWADNQGKSGIIPENSFHSQSYYPNAVIFPGINPSQYTLKGTRIEGFIDLSNPGVVNSYRRKFGYADNTPVISFTEKRPDNPYTYEIEGSGGDAIDMDWAVDKDLKPVYLDEINFIRIYTGMNALAGWLGEISTEITGIRDVEPFQVTGIQTMMVIQDFAPKIRINDSVNLNAFVFDQGLKQETKINWSVSNPELAQIINGKLTAIKSGTFQLKASSSVNPNIFSEKELEIFSFGKAIITVPSKSIKVNDKLELTGKITDQNGIILTGINPVWRVGNDLIAEIVPLDGKYFLKGKQTGKCWLFLETDELNPIRDSVLIEVFPESALKKVYISVKTTEKTIVPRQSVWVNQSDLTPKVDHAQKSYSLSDIPFVSLAHAIASTFNKLELASDFAFRDDAEGGSALYLWKVPAIEDGSKVYTYGYGGSQTSASYRKTWVVMLNQQPVVNGFDQIKVNNDDEILIYHIADNSLPWMVSHLTSGTDSIKAHEKIQVQYKNYSCYMDANRNIVTKASEVIANQPIQVESKIQPVLKLTTDEWGNALFMAENSGDYLIKAGINESMIFAESITGNRPLITNQLSCKVYPNPFTETIGIETPLTIRSVKIYNTEGQCVYKDNGLKTTIDLLAIRSGIYVIRIWIGNQVFQQKIVKN
ncbi:MAG: T9SS type A sorting domain-containing protein [Bacteroidota bacterium]|nr:hypothetical protein [Odoribacter sp.]MDP3643939.1 T9SS type A sorting domain-containing protein [Bacteroidota bacterium]